MAKKAGKGYEREAATTNEKLKLERVAHQTQLISQFLWRTTEDGPVLFVLKPGYLKSLDEEFGIG